MNEKMLNDIYNDFFPERKKEDIEETIEEDNEPIEDKIEGLYLTEDSKEVFKKIVSYINSYDKEKESDYIEFNIKLVSNNEELVKDLATILKKCVNKSKYVKSGQISYMSLYKIEKVEQLSEIYEKSAIVIIKDLKAFDMYEDNFKKKFIYELKNIIKDKNSITILFGSKEELQSLLQNDESLDNNYFRFKLEGTNPDNNDVYQKILDLLPKDLVTDKLKIELLDYISETYPKTNLDYPTYRDNLYKEITFNKTVPKLEISKSLEEIFAELNELVGLEKVKKTLYDLESLINLKNKTKDDLKISNVNLHMVFLGNPGTGKTTVARLVAGILYNLKYIKQDKLIEVSSKDLVAEYVGQTAPKTMSVVEKAMGGVLFIDEAYALASDQNNSYNDEAIATLIKAMEDYRDNLVVIFAGYTKEMQAFLDSNSGIVSRIGYMLEFDDYTTDELVEIFKGMIKKAGFTAEDKAIDKLKEVIEKHKNDENFGNARFVRNVYEKSVIKHAYNTKDIKRKSILKTITEKDIVDE